MPGNGTSVQVNGTSNISGTLRPGVDLLNDSWGYFYGKGAITINNTTATIVPYLINSLHLGMGTYSEEVNFLSSDAATLTGSNVFPAARPTITMVYDMNIDDDKDYFLTITRVNFLSEVLDGDAKSIVKWMEDNSYALLNNADSSGLYSYLLDLYSDADMSYDINGAEDIFNVENLIPDTATKRLNAINENMLDAANSALSQRLTVHNNRTELIPLSDKVRDGFWVTPLGTIMNFYPDEKLGRAIYSGAGLNLGIAKFLNNNSSYGLGLTYIDGYYDDSNADFGKFDTSILNASLGYRTNPGTSKLWFEGMLSYAHNTADAYAVFNETKSDTYRASAKAGIDLGTGSWRFTPALGVDYTYYDFGAPMIDAGLVTMNVKDTDSLRPMAEVEAVYNAKDATRFGVKVGYSYEALGKGIEQEMDLFDDDNLIPLSTTTDRSPRHNGHIGLSVNHAINDAVSFAAEYDLRLNDVMTTNTFKLNFKWLY